MTIKQGSESAINKRIFLKGLSYTFLANIFSLLISTATVLIIPRHIDVETFGYYQLYMFYINYVGLFCLGWNEGVYLILGGKYYANLDKGLYCTQFWLQCIAELGIYFIVFFFNFKFNSDENKVYIIGCTCAVAIAMCLRWFTTSILQATARTKENAILIFMERLIFGIAILALLLFKNRGFKLLVCADVVAKYISLGIGIWYCRDIYFSKILPVKKVISNIKDNMSAGIKLMLASLSSMLIIGVVRFGIEHHWDISTFGKVSLTLSISNMAVTAINAIGVVIYPILRRTNQEKLPEIYKIMRIMLMGLVFGALVFYYPAQKILTLWLPQYAESLRYAAILLPVCVYESKVSILVNTYFNTLRLESLQMKCNLIALALSVVLTGISIYVFDSVTVAILSILVVLMFRCILCETVLSTKLPVKVVKDIIIELVMTVLFVICNWYFGLLGMIMYAVCYVVYLFIKRKDIIESLNFIKAMR